MLNKVKIIKKSKYWICDNMDIWAPIIEEGMMYLLSDGTIQKFKNNVTDDNIKNMPYATKEEQQAYASKTYGYIFKGDTVKINRGRKMVGEIKTVKGHYRYYVNGTYEKCYTDYLIFTDGTKVNINYCDVIGINCCQSKYKSYADTFNDSLIIIGGRL